MTDIVERLKYSLSTSYSELRKEAAIEIMRLRAKIEASEKERDVLRGRLALESQENGALRDSVDRACEERDALRTELNEIRYGVAVAHDTIKALRDKIKAMENQEPVAWLHETRRDSDVVTDAVKHVWGKAVVGALAAYSIPLYLAPGAQPAPSVPTALLVAVANLVAQMEIVSRVGFVDMPNDKDSCAAFCVAEGTWLELVSCVESLASALAAAPKTEVK